MRKLLTGEQMRTLEAETMRLHGLTSLDLMRRASRAMADTLIDALGPETGRVCVFACGNGGNGADGYACARLFALSGGHSVIVDALPDAPHTREAAFLREEALRTPHVCLAGDISDMPVPSAWVDAVFGIGLSRAPGTDEQALFARIARDRSRGAFVLSCDIPSGLRADTGMPFLGGGEMCVRADCTVTFEHAKPGHFLGEGLDLCGRLAVCPIGLDADLLPENAVSLCEAKDLRALTKPRAHNSHKGTYGHLLLIAGSFGMAGAAAMAAGAALRSGTGLVTVACPRSVVPVIQTLAPCAVCLPLPESNGAISEEALPVLRAALAGKMAVAAGPGLSQRIPKELLRMVLESGLPCVLDADALNVLSENKELYPLLHSDCVITPHPGEAARLITPVQGDALATAHALQALGCTALYKGAASVICSPAGCAVSASGSPGMARGGSGDVLTGIIGALLARGTDVFAAAYLGSEAHGLAGEAAACRQSETGMTAWDEIESLPEVWRNA